MRISYKNLLGYERDSKSGLGFETYKMIYLWGKTNDLEKIHQYVLNKFTTYRQGSGVKFGEHEIHIWWSDRHSQLTLNGEKNGEKRNKEIYTDILNQLETTFKDLDITVEFCKDYQLSATKIEEFIDNYEIDINNLHLEKLSVIADPGLVGFPKLKEETWNKWFSLNIQFINMLGDTGKKFIINDIKGSFKKLNNGQYGFFKLRVRKSYYNFKLNNIISLEVCS